MLTLIYFFHFYAIFLCKSAQNYDYNISVNLKDDEGDGNVWRLRSQIGQCCLYPKPKLSEVSEKQFETEDRPHVYYSTSRARPLLYESPSLEASSGALVTSLGFHGPVSLASMPLVPPLVPW